MLKFPYAAEQGERESAWLCVWHKFKANLKGTQYENVDNKQRAKALVRTVIASIVIECSPRICQDSEVTHAQLSELTCSNAVWNPRIAISWTVSSSSEEESESTPSNDVCAIS